MKRLPVLTIGLLAVAVMFTSYLLATAHEPQSYWLWHNVLRVLP